MWEDAEVHAQLTLLDRTLPNSWPVHRIKWSN
jgi:hypothetical protein